MEEISSPPTRADAWKHVFENILQLDKPKNGTFASALDLSGVSSITDIMLLSSDQIQNMKTRDSSSAEIRDLHDAFKSRIHAFQQFVRVNSLYGRNSSSKWLDYSEEDFTDFILENYDPSLIGKPIRSMSSKETSVSTPTMVANSQKRDPVIEFKRGIKRDITAFTALKEDKQWDAWDRNTIAQARAQDVSEVLDPLYHPKTETDVALFDEKQKYMFAVFEKNLLTDQGKAVVREHASSYDAQQVYRDIKNYALDSTKANIEASNLLSYITSAKIGDGHWKGTAEGFILHWQDQVRRYEAMSHRSKHLHDATKKQMLENAVNAIDELRAVKRQADQIQTVSGTELTYRQYCRLVMSAAAQYDSQFKSQRLQTPKSSNRSVYNHVVNHGQDLEVDGDVFYDIDSEIESIHVYNSSVNNKKSFKPFEPTNRLSSDQWHRLSTDEQQIWDQLPQKAKAIILERRFDNRTSVAHPPRPRTANLHDISAYDYVMANLHDLRMGSDGDVNLTSQSTMDHVDSAENNKTNDNFDPDESPILAHLTQRKEIPPGDLRRVLAKTMNHARKPPTKIIDDQDEITLNGKKYRSINFQKLIYDVSKPESAIPGALIDRGANGGVAGADVRIINFCARKDNVIKIFGFKDNVIDDENTQVMDIPLATVGAVIKTIKGDIIGIFNNYAYVKTGISVHSPIQIEHFGHDVNDKSKMIEGGLQRIKTTDGHEIPIQIKGGLPYISSRPFTDHEWDVLPHVIMTSPSEWDPTAVDHENRLDKHTDWDKKIVVIKPANGKSHNTFGIGNDKAHSETETLKSPNDNPVGFNKGKSGESKHPHETAIVAKTIGDKIDNDIELFYFINSHYFKDDPAPNIAVNDAYKDAKDYSMVSGRYNTTNHGLNIEPKYSGSDVPSLNIEPTPTNGETIHHTNNVEFVKKDTENPGLSNIEQAEMQIKPIVDLKYSNSKASELHLIMAPRNGEMSLKLLKINATDEIINIFDHRHDFHVVTKGKYGGDLTTDTKKKALCATKHSKFRSFIGIKGFELYLNLLHDFKRIFGINHRRNHYENHEFMILDLSKHKKYGLYVAGRQDNVPNMHQIYFDVIWGEEGGPVGVIMVWFQVVTKYVSMLGCNGFQH